MRSLFALAALTLGAPAVAATRTYDTASFDSVSVASGIEVDITLGPVRSVVAETNAPDFDDLRITVEGNELRIRRPSRSWFSFFTRRPDFHVRVVMPDLRKLAASSGSSAEVRGTVQGDFTVESSSGSQVELDRVNVGVLKAHSSSGSQLELSGTCVSLDAETSSGSELDAGNLNCDKVKVQASSGSNISLGTTRSIVGSASSGAAVRVRGAPSVVDVRQSSGGDVVVKN